MLVILITGGVGVNGEKVWKCESGIAVNDK